MLFYWLYKVLLRLRWLLVPPEARDVARVDPNAPCPACNARAGTIRAVHRQTPEEKWTVKIQHTCNLCAARWFEPTVVKATTQTIWHGIPRNDIEATDDAEVVLSKKRVEENATTLFN